MTIPNTFNPMIRSGDENTGWNDTHTPLRDFLKVAASVDDNGMLACNPANIEKHIENVFKYGNTAGLATINGNEVGVWFIETVDKPMGWSDTDEKNYVTAF